MEDYSIVIIAVIFTTLSQLNSYMPEEWKNRVCNKFNPYFPQLTTKLKEQTVLVETNNSISAQDNYAQWTKNNRKLDQLKKEIGELKENLIQFNKSKISLWNKLNKLVITIPFLLFKLWKGKSIVYRLPSNQVFPSVINGVWHNGFLFVALAPLNWIRHGTIHPQTLSTENNFISFGVSLGIWCWALNTVISTIEFIVNQLFIRDKVIEPTTNEKLAKPL